MITDEHRADLRKICAIEDDFRVDATTVLSLLDEIDRLQDHLDLRDRRIHELEARQKELHKLIVRLTNETPYPDEVKNWTAQRAAMVAEIGTLKARIKEMETGC